MIVTKKTGAVLLVAAIAFVLMASLSACDTQDKSKEEDASSKSASAVVEPAVAEPAVVEPAAEPKTTPAYVIEIDLLKEAFVQASATFHDGASHTYQSKMNENEAAVTDDAFINDVYVPESQELIAATQAFLDYNGILNEECQSVHDQLVAAAKETISALSEMEKGAKEHDLSVFGAGLHKKARGANSAFTEAFDALQVLVDRVYAEWDESPAKSIVIASGKEISILDAEMTGRGIRAMISWDTDDPALSAGDTVEVDGASVEIREIEYMNFDTGEDVLIKSTKEYDGEPGEIPLNIYFYLW